MMWSSTASSMCTTCAPGYASGSGAPECSICPAGTYAYAAVGQLGCELCLDGKYSLAGASECILCQNGRFSGPGASACDTCMS